MIAALIFDAALTAGGPYQFFDYTRAFRASSGKIYVPFAKPVGGSDMKAIVWESSDDGATWSQSDNTDSPTGLYGAASAFKRPDQDYIVFSYFDSATSKLCLWRFDMAAGAWEPSAYATGGPDYVNPSTSGGYAYPRLAVRCDDSVVVQVRAADSGARKQVGYAIWTGSAWASGSLGDTSYNWYAFGLYITPDQSVHMLTQRQVAVAASGPDDYLVHQVIGTDNSVGSIEVITDSGAESTWADSSHAIPWPVVTDDGRVYLAQNLEPLAFHNNFDTYIPATLFVADTGVSPTWTVRFEYLYEDATAASWQTVLPIAYKEAGLVWEEAGGSGSKFYYGMQAITSGQQMCWIQPALIFSGQPTDNVIWEQPVSESGFDPSASIYNGALTPRILSLSITTLNPLSYCGIVGPFAYFGVPTAARADGTTWGWLA